MHCLLASCPICAACESHQEDACRRCACDSQKALTVSRAWRLFCHLCSALCGQLRGQACLHLWTFLRPMAHLGQPRNFMLPTARQINASGSCCVAHVSGPQHQPPGLCEATGAVVDVEEYERCANLTFLGVGSMRLGGMLSLQELIRGCVYSAGRS